MSSTHKRRNYDGSQKLESGERRSNKRDEAVFSLSKRRSGGLDIADFDGEKLFNLIVACLAEDCAILVSKVYGGRAVRIKLFGDGKNAAGEADTLNELDALVESAMEVLGYERGHQEDAPSEFRDRDIGKPREDAGSRPKPRKAARGGSTPASPQRSSEDG